jgi:hypothetical protein
MNHSKAPWAYDEESGEVTTKDRRGYWGPPNFPVTVCTLETLDGIHNGPLIAAAPELAEVLRSLLDWLMDDSRVESDAVAIYDAGRAVLAKLQDPVPAWQDDAYDATDRTAIHTDCASVQK